MLISISGSQHTMRSNPYYVFSKTQSQFSMTEKDAFLVHHLNHPRATYQINWNGQVLSFLNHHISIYSEYEEGTGPKSLYHYTAYFGDYVVHVYFDKERNKSNPYIKHLPNDEQLKNPMEILTETEHDTIHSLLDRFVTPHMDNLIISHKKTQQNLRQTYHEQLKDIHTILFDHAAQVEENLLKLSSLIELGHRLKDICFNTEENKSIRSLEKQYAALKNAKDEKDKPISIAHPINDEEIEISEEISSQKIEYLFTSPPKKSQSAEFKVNIDTEYTKITALLAHYETLKFTEWSAKTETLNQALDLINTLSITMDDQDTDFEVCIKLETLRHDVMKKGSTLLYLMLSSRSMENKLQDIGQRLKVFSSYISIDELGILLQKGNTKAFLFMLEHTTASVNGKIEDSYFIEVCYKHNNIDCFKALLKKKANILFTNSEGIPFAHQILTQSVDDPFRIALITHAHDLKFHSKHFYSNIISMLEEKLLDPHLTSPEIATLRRSIEIYTIAKNSDIKADRFNQLALTESLKVGLKFNPNTMNQVREMPEYRQKLERILLLDKEIKDLAKKARLKKSLTAAGSRHAARTNQTINASEQFTRILESFDPTMVLSSMDNFIVYLQKSRDLVQYVITPPKTNKQKKEYEKLHTEVQEMEKILDIKSIEELSALKSEIADLVLNMNSSADILMDAMRILNKSLGMFNVKLSNKVDTNPELDFWKTAMSEEETLAHAGTESKNANAI